MHRHSTKTKGISPLSAKCLLHHERESFTLREKAYKVMEDQGSQAFSLEVSYLLQQTLRSLCSLDNSHWLYAVFWRILPRNYPPPKWDSQGAMLDRTRGNRRNWILVWEDGFCNFMASPRERRENWPTNAVSTSLFPNSHTSTYMEPQNFFKMSHEVYNYGEGLIGKVAADNSHKWIFREQPQDQETASVSPWQTFVDPQPRIWEAQFQSGIQTIALIAVKEGVIQLGSLLKVMEDLNYIAILKKKFSYLHSIPGVLLPHPSTNLQTNTTHPHTCQSHLQNRPAFYPLLSPQPNTNPPKQTFSPNFLSPQTTLIAPSMTSLESLLSKLPSIQMPNPNPNPNPSLNHIPNPNLSHIPNLNNSISSSTLTYYPLDYGLKEQEEEEDQKEWRSMGLSLECNGPGGKLKEKIESDDNCSNQFGGMDFDLAGEGDITEDCASSLLMG
ncbi:hypothetical protein AMTRI_Chr12g240340 [Amborella trichopoda]